jgi:hypothetical protein
MPGGIFRSGEEAAAVTALAGALTLAAAAVVTSERLDRGQAAVSFREKIL